MIIEYYVGSTHWTECDDRTDEFVNRAATFNGMTHDEVLAKLNTGADIYHRADSEAIIRVKRAPKTSPVDLSATAPAHDWYER